MWATVKGYGRSISSSYPYVVSGNVQPYPLEASSVACILITVGRLTLSCAKQPSLFCLSISGMLFFALAGSRIRSEKASNLLFNWSFSIYRARWNPHFFVYAFFKVKGWEDLQDLEQGVVSTMQSIHQISHHYLTLRSWPPKYFQNTNYLSVRRSNIFMNIHLDAAPG